MDVTVVVVIAEKYEIEISLLRCNVYCRRLGQIPPADRIPVDPGHKARKDPSDNADLDFQALGPALRIMQLNVEGLSAAKRSIIHAITYREASH